MMFGSNTTDNSWSVCNGQQLAISQHAALFAIIRDYYGGDGVSTFQIADFSGRKPLGSGTGMSIPKKTYSLGNIGGTSQVVLNEANVPRHNHPVFFSQQLATTVTPTTTAMWAESMSSFLYVNVITALRN